MAKKTKVTIAALAILIGMVALIFYFSKQKKEEQFQLIDHVSETDIAYHANFIELLDEAIQYNSKVEKSITNNIALSEIKSTLLKSGLKLEKTYFTFSISEEKYSSFYMEIVDSSLFEDAFTKLSSFFNIKPLKEKSNLYISGNTAISAEKHPKYIKLNFGNGALNALSDKKSKPGLFFKKLLEKSNFGIINTTGTPHIDSTDYATFFYNYNNDLSLTMDWKVAKNHPIQFNSETGIEIYPTRKKNVQAFINFDKEHLISTINPFLKDKSTLILAKLPAVAKELLELWNGKTSIQMGGKSTYETIQIITEFDDDFNQVEKKIVKIDSIPDVGIYWGSNQPAESLALIYQLPNVKSDKDKMQIALLPSLNTKTENNSIKANTQKNDFKNQELKQIFYLNVNIPGIIGELKAEKTSENNLRLQLVLKDWNALRNPKSLSISSFW
ncbi:hypothetical protein ERX46_01155 [Brumimicrobium glaciale]|uniref:Uncharacterized protein n=1 Tax=Brumimicrobium glaciale TaxID=200475 RepID=A0A4Q4KQE8_9FLAO|nr:hypothetical protein [Brumimicrobium glaciale]RYM35627.1 hypothetical protein ERX46_01155 [Brumimicrobium glaciale]